MPIEGIKKCVCQSCGCEWHTDRPPKRCPGCDEVSWNRARFTISCISCGHVWSARAIHPERCPSCHSPRPDKPQREQVRCKRCTHVWYPLHGKTPKVCAKDSCHSKRWDWDELTCVACGYRWLPTEIRHPAACPVCSCTKWDGQEAIIRKQTEIDARIKNGQNDATTFFKEEYGGNTNVCIMGGNKREMWCEDCGYGFDAYLPKEIKHCPYCEAPVDRIRERVEQYWIRSDPKFIKNGGKPK